MKKRIDLLLVELGLVESRQKAQALIYSNQILANDQPVAKPGQLVSQEAQIRIRALEHSFVSRGGIKLSHALDRFQVSADGRVALDVGASTGGFTEVLLSRNATKVFAVDVGYGQMNWKLRQDPRVVLLERKNARLLNWQDIGETVDVITIDVSFISLEKIIPSLIQFSHVKTDWITLVKPQFEVGKGKIGKGGIVRLEKDQNEVLDRVICFCKSHSLKAINLIESPITGAKGNKEFFIHWQKEE
ncbi:MAG: TlyA family RNA methyltransferase [Bdellovibrio sp.]|nr:TlyA family RNA methyltransferase [Bdellovibrio sp.]